MSFGIDKVSEFRPVNIALLTVSDTRTLKNDASGDILEKRIIGAGHKLTRRDLLRDESSSIRKLVEEWIEALVLTLETDPDGMRIFGHISDEGGMCRCRGNDFQTNRSPLP